MIAETVRSHPRPGSNTNGNLVAAPLTIGVVLPMSARVHDSDGVAPTLAAQSGPNRGGDEGLKVLAGAMVRRLTPAECERLQGFPDGWTQLGGTPDSRRYAALGDAVTAPVAEWIGRRLAAA